ncbi:MAG: metallophosphoesterase family protein, partial [Candidatus Latescibacteria bacterium]|nr:metallophosphoesterase family protein [Candidatus Latescibacterota bacterium]
MIVAVCSDVHDNIWALERTLPRMAEADAYVFCGDFCAPFTLAQLAEATAAKPLHVVWGNNDGDRHMLTQVAARFDHVVLHGELASVELGGLRTAVNHYPDIASGLADASAIKEISAIAMRCGGCGAKVGSTVLGRALAPIQPTQR